jgi:hypothetical protein
MEMAILLVNKAHQVVGGRFIKVDCSNIPGLIHFCERHDFQLLQEDASTGMVEMVRIL